MCGFCSLRSVVSWLYLPGSRLWSVALDVVGIQGTSPSWKPCISNHELLVDLLADRLAMNFKRAVLETCGELLGRYSLDLLLSSATCTSFVACSNVAWLFTGKCSTCCSFGFLESADVLLEGGGVGMLPVELVLGWARHLHVRTTLWPCLQE